MQTLHEMLSSMNSRLLPKIDECKRVASPILAQIVTRFPTYTAHDITHSESVASNCRYFIDETSALSEDELYILSVATILHDIGMAITDNQLLAYAPKCHFDYNDSLSGDEKRELIRTHHHMLAECYILAEWEAFHIPSKRYAEIISTVAKGHRNIELNTSEYDSIVVNTGSVKVRVALLSSILRMADEFDITNERTPQLYVKYHYPNNRTSQDEFNKHLSTTLIEYPDVGSSIATILYNTDNTNVYHLLQTMFNKIIGQLESCQKMLSMRGLPGLKIRHVETKNECTEFRPISIKFTTDNERIFKTLIGKNLYKNKFVAIRECLQNSIDACRYRKQRNVEYAPQITVELTENVLTITDNGIGMDKNIIENYFSVIGKSFYIHDVNAQKDFKSIGQFGIGVASYFLICDSFRLTTCKDDETLDFVITNNFDEYFQLSSNGTSMSQGTRISFDLHSSVTEEITIEHLKKNINSAFRFCEVPISIADGVGDVVLTTESFDNHSVTKTFNGCFLPYYNDKSDLFTIDCISVESDIIQMACGFVCCHDGTPVDTLYFPKYKDMRNWFHDINNSYNKINIYYKSV